MWSTARSRSPSERYEGPRLLIFRPGDRITVKAIKPTRMMFLGGDALEGPRHIWWNFVSSSKERIEQAKQDWKTGRFAPVPERTRVHSAAGVSYLPSSCRSRCARCALPRKPDPMTTMLASDLPLPRIGRGKVRDIYAVGDDRVLLLDHRPHQRVRRGDGRDHPDEGRGADPDQRLVVRRSSKAWCRIT